MRRNSKATRTNRYTVDASGEPRFTCASLKLAMIHADSLRRKGKAAIIWDTIKNQQVGEQEKP